MASPVDETLERVYRRGHQLRLRRRTRRGLAAVAVIAALAVPVLAANEDGATDRLRAAAGPDSVTTTTTEVTSVPVTTGVPTSTSPATTPTTGEAAITVPDAPTTTALVCRNSADRRCGPFRWDPALAPNQPASLRVTYDPAQSVAGQEVVFTLVYTDPDSDERPLVKNVEFGDGESGGSMVACEAQPPRYGPWSPPEPRAGSHTEIVRHTYMSGGTFLARFHAVAGQCSQDPYASAAQGVVTVIVRESG